MTAKPCGVRGVRGSTPTKTIKRFNTVLLALGLAFLLHLIEKTGWRELELQFRVLGSGSHSWLAALYSPASERERPHCNYGFASPFPLATLSHEHGWLGH
jgi:hypothetical protein